MVSNSYMPIHRVIKVAALAEDSCDATMLPRAQNPRLYSEYLIYLAPAVKGACVPAATHSRYRATATAALCGLALAALGACNLQRTQKPAPGQFSMNEMEKRDAAEREKQAAVENTLLLEAKSMTPEQAAAKVAALKDNPQDERTYYQLMRYYEFHSDLKGKDALILWYIEHEPGGKVRPWNINPVGTARVTSMANDSGKLTSRGRARTPRYTTVRLRFLKAPTSRWQRRSFWRVARLIPAMRAGSGRLAGTTRWRCSAPRSR